MGQLQAGFYLQEIYRLFKDSPHEAPFRQLMHYLSFFELESPQLKEESSQSHEPLAAVAANIISRGMPTHASPYLQEIFRLIFRQEQDWSALYLTDNPEADKLREQIFQALHIIDPRVTKDMQTKEFQQNWDRFGHEHKEEFFFHLAPEYLGAPFLQLLEQDMHMHTLLYYAHAPASKPQEYLQGKTKDKIASELDFSMTFPYAVDGKQGLVFEVRDARKEKLEQRNIDSTRDQAIAAAGWLHPFRYRTTEFSRINKKFRELRPVIESDLFNRISTNYNTPLYEATGGMAALQFALTPFAVARIQRTLLEMIYTGKLRFNAANWHIAIIERDVPAAAIALADLLQLLAHLRYMRDGHKQLPEIQLHAFYTEEFSESALENHMQQAQNLPFRYKRYPLEKFGSHTQYHALLDVSVMQRRGVKNTLPQNQAQNTARIRSIHNLKSQRCFSMDRRITYAYAGNEEGTQSLEYLLQMIFGKKTFLPGQAALLQGILQQRNMLGILPPHGGKSMVQQMAALLQPAPSISIIPSSHMAVDQELEQNRHAIQMSDRFSIINQSPEERERIRERFLNRQILMLYAFAGNFQNKRFRGLLNEGARHFTEPGYAFIDEVHSISEWGHDFRPPYFNITANIKNHMRGSDNSEPTILGLTSAASYTTMYDVMRALNIGDNQVIDRSDIPGKLHYRFLRIVNKDVFYNTPINKALEKTALRKQLQLIQQLEEWYGNPAEKQQKPGKTLVICPEQKGLLGITDDQGKGVGDKLRSHFRNLTIKEFSGSYENHHRQASMRTTAKSLQNVADARLEQAHIILSSEDMAIGINTPGIHNVIYLNTPASVEKFIQINGRAIRQKREGNILLMYNDQLIQYNNKTFNNLLLHSKQEDQFNTTPDQYINLQLFSRYCTSVEKEQAVIEELMEEITFPEDRAENLIAEAIENEYGVNVSLNYHPADNPYQLYINHANKTFGYIDYRSYSAITDNATLDPELGSKILEFTKKEIERLMPEAENVFKWLRQPVHQNAIPGIEKICNKITENEEASLSIHFRNKYLTLIAELLQEHISSVFTEKKVRDAYLNTPDREHFTGALEAMAGFNKHNDPDRLREQIFDHYKRIREREDTFAAIRRLVIIGVVEDFTIDFHSRMFNLTISPKSARSYRVRLHNFMAHYVSPNRADLVYEEFEDYPGSTDLRKATFRLVRFMYDVVIPYHFRGIKRMSELPKIAGEEEEQQNNIAVYLRFHNRAFYANPFLEPNLRKDTNDLEEEKYKILLKYFKEAGDFRENWRHLIESTRVLMQESPANYVLKILHAYSSMLLYQEDETRFFRAYDDLSEGAIRMYRYDNISYQDFMTKLNIIVKKLYEKDRGLQKQVEPVLNLKIHNEWIKHFNRRFLEGYQEKYQLAQPKY